MFKKIQEEFKVDDEMQSKINMVTFYVNIFILIVHCLLFIFYFLANARFMMIIDVVAIIIYIYYFKRCVKDTILYSKTTFAEIWFHMIAAVIVFGWEPGFQNWTYGLVSAFFLPSLTSYDDGKVPRRPQIAGINFVIIYYVLAISMNILNMPIRHPLNDFYNHLLFAINTLVTFIAIFSFTFFYTSIHRKKEDELMMRADYDELTGLRNRHSINEIIETEVIKGSSFSLAILDIDFFKKVNDTYGHNTGDVVLKYLARKLKKLEGYGIKAARYGGEEFLILGPSDMSKKDFINLLEEFRKKIELSIVKANKNTINITVSIGIAEYNGDTKFKYVIEKADNNLYDAKESGRNKIIY